MSILRSLDQCKILGGDKNYPKTLHTVVGFTWQLSRIASSTFHDIFEEIRMCCSAKRQIGVTNALMFVITDYLGEMYKEIGSLSHTLLLESYAVSPDHLAKRLWLTELASLQCLFP